MIFSDNFGIDLGADTIKIYDQKTDSISAEKNILAVEKDGRVLAMGEEAYAMLGITPKSIRMKTPVSEGKIRDIYLLDAILLSALYRNHRTLGIRPELYFSVPTDMTEIERRAYAAISRRGRLKNCTVYFVDKAYADAFAMDLPVKDCKGVLIVNFGASVTYSSVISNGRIILERAIPIGGNHINEAILSAIRRKNNLSVGFRTAEELKLQLSDLDGSADAGPRVIGLDTENGLPRDGFVTAHTIRSAVEAQAKELIARLEEFIHRIPPQVREKVDTEGIRLTGGSSRIGGFSGLLARSLNMPVCLAETYENTTVLGLQKVMTDPSLKEYARIPEIRQRR